ncbi:hypothetical protein BJX76DRAFT_75420 [Aspergillus varians]
MLKPFLIRDLDEAPQLHDIIDDSASDLYNATDVSVGPQQRHGLVQLAAADYDEIAYIHPQARLTYLDEDDGETITVGSSLELAQRLDEPPPQITDTGFPATIHLFDIKRRKSITDLWKRYQYNDRLSASQDTQVGVDNVDDRATAPEPNTRREENSHPEDGQTNTTGNDGSESFLSAFETEMARVMVESQRSENNDSERASSPRTPQAESASNLPRETAEAFASALRSLIEVAESISSGVKSKLPELERHLDNARKTLPSDITDSMRSAFLAFETQVKAMASTFNNLPETIRRDNGPGSPRVFPEFPTPYDAINGLREMGVQLGGMGQTLLGAFESSIRGAFPGQRDSFFSNFPNFSDSNNFPASVPGNVAGNFSSPRDGTTARLATHSNNLPGVSPFRWQPMAVPSPVEDFPNLYQTSFHPPGPAPFATIPASSAAPQSHQTRSDTDLPDLQPPQPLSHLEPHSSRSLFIGNVGFNVTERMVKDVFMSKGLSVDVHLPTDSRTSKHAGFGYLTFPSEAEATSGLTTLQGVVIDGHCINLEYVDHTPITSMMPEEPNIATASSPQTSGVIRRGSPDRSLVSMPDANTEPKPSNETVHDLLLAQTEARFPPVSQLDAHMLAEQSSGPRQSATSPGSRNAFPSGETGDATLAGSDGRSQLLPGSFPQEAHYAPLSETSIEAQPTPLTSHRHNYTPHYEFPHHLRHPHPHRAATMRSSELHRRSFDPFEPQPGLRRRATERHSLRNLSHMRGPVGPRPRASFHQLSQPIPDQTQNLSAHEEEPAPHLTRKEAKKQRRQRAIDECVSALTQMGYGSEEGGGQRLAIYAAAANGELVDAIEMIEEERMAYEQRG